MRQWSVGMSASRPMRGQYPDHSGPMRGQTPACQARGIVTSNCDVGVRVRVQWPLWPGPDHRRLWRHQSLTPTWLCPACCMLQSPLSCSSSCSVQAQQHSVKPVERTRSGWCERRNYLAENRGLILQSASLQHIRWESVSGLTILITMRSLWEVKTALLTLRWPCCHTLCNIQLARWTFIFSRQRLARLTLLWIEDNLRDTNRLADPFGSEFTSSCSLYPQILPTGRNNPGPGSISYQYSVLTQACVTVIYRRTQYRGPASLEAATIVSGNKEIHSRHF